MNNGGPMSEASTSATEQFTLAKVNEVAGGGPRPEA